MLEPEIGDGKHGWRALSGLTPGLPVQTQSAMIVRLIKIPGNDS